MQLENHEAHSWAYTALIRISPQFFKKRNSNATFNSHAYSHTDFVCQLKAYPLEVKTELKPARYWSFCQLPELCTGRTLSLISKQNFLLFLKFTPDLDLLNQKCQSASRPTQAASHIGSAWSTFVYWSVWSFPHFTTDLQTQPLIRAPCERIHVPTLWCCPVSWSVMWLSPLEMSGKGMELLGDQQQWDCKSSQLSPSGAANSRWQGLSESLDCDS